METSGLSVCDPAPAHQRGNLLHYGALVLLVLGLFDVRIVVHLLYHFVNSYDIILG